MKKYDYDLVVIGGGAAGLTCSTGAGQLGAKVLLIEKEGDLGGDCLHFGCVPSKSLIKSATVYHQIRRAQDYGLPMIQPPPVDLAHVQRRIKWIIAQIQRHDTPERIKEKYNVDTRLGKACLLEDHVIQVDNDRVSVRNIVISTGSSPMVFEIPNIDQVPYLTNETVFDLDRLPSSMAVLGGGPIGIEMAQAFSRLGSKVSVIEYGPMILGKEDKDISKFMEEKLRKEGIKIYTSHEALEVEKREDGDIGVIIKDRDKEDRKAIIAGKLFVATGRKANVDGLGLDSVGIKYSARGIKVDDRLRTTVKNIYACGDVNGGLQFTHVAGYEAGIAMVNAVLHLPAKVDYRNVPWVTYMDPEVASVGYNETRAQQEGLKYRVEVEQLRHNDRALAETEYDGYVKLLVGKKDIPIGVQIVAPHAGDLLSEWVAVINAKIPLTKVAQMVHPYPTFSEVNKAVAGNYLAPSFFNNPVVKWLSSL